MSHRPVTNGNELVECYEKHFNMDDRECKNCEYYSHCLEVYEEEQYTEYIEVVCCICGKKLGPMDEGTYNHKLNVFKCKECSEVTEDEKAE